MSVAIFLSCDLCTLSYMINMSQVSFCNCMLVNVRQILDPSSRVLQRHFLSSSLLVGVHHDKNACVPTQYISFSGLILCIVREKGRDLTQSYYKSPYSNRKIQRLRDNTKTPPKLRLHNDCGPTKDGQLE